MIGELDDGTRQTLERTAAATVTRRSGEASGCVCMTRPDTARGDAAAKRALLVGGQSGISARSSAARRKVTVAATESASNAARSCYSNSRRFASSENSLPSRYTREPTIVEGSVA